MSRWFRCAVDQVARVYLHITTSLITEDWKLSKYIVAPTKSCIDTAVQMMQNDLPQHEMATFRYCLIARLPMLQTQMNDLSKNEHATRAMSSRMLYNVLYKCVE